jgi:hypothetical protein
MLVQVSLSSILEWFNDGKELNDPATAGDFGDEQPAA